MHSTSSQPTRPLPRAAVHGNLQDFFAIGEGRGKNLNKPLKLSLSWLKINREQVQSVQGALMATHCSPAWGGELGTCGHPKFSGSSRMRISFTQRLGDGGKSHGSRGSPGLLPWELCLPSPALLGRLQSRTAGAKPPQLP